MKNIFGTYYYVFWNICRCDKRKILKLEKIPFEYVYQKDFNRGV